MRYLEFRRQLGPLLVFSLNDARVVEPGFDRRRLHEWKARGHIIMVASGYYVFSESRIDEAFLARVANRIYAPSYVSLETVLSRAGIIPETVRQVTSVSTRKTRILKTPLGTFSYRTVTPRLFFGYEIGENGIRTASVEKALLDYLYLRVDLRSRADFESLRVDPSELRSGIDQARFSGLLRRFDIRSLEARVKNFRRWARYA